MKYFRKLPGKQIYLSPVNPDDVEKYAKWVNDLSIAINLGSASTVYSLMSERSFLEEQAKDGQNFAIVSNDTDELIGACSLFNIRQVHRTAEIGIFIGDEQYRNRGIGTEAMRLLVSYGFKILNLHNIMLNVMEFNKGAIRAYEKAGFRVCGRRTEAYYVNGKYYDIIQMEVLSTHFQSDDLAEKMPKDEN